MALSGAARQDLLDTLQAFGAAYGSAAIPSGQGKALEAWVLMLLAHIANGVSGWTASLRQGDGRALPPGAAFTIPQGGSKIHRSHPTAPGHVRLEFAPQSSLSLELHGSVRWRGRSGVLHECDVSAVPMEIAQRLRGHHQGGYPRGLPAVLIECKDKGGTGALDETRQTLARMFDLVLVTQPGLGLAPCRIYEDRTPSGWGTHYTAYRDFFAVGAFGIVRASGFQRGAGKLAVHYSIGHHPTIYTSTTSVTQLQHNFRNMLVHINLL